jgi:NAD(P)-dependent dehydrogenase (short-subunit alcohol dehydrogenase family)
LGHFLLTNLLMPKLLLASTTDKGTEGASSGFGPRIVNMTSSGHRISPVLFDDYNFENRTYEGWTAYGQAKTANMLFSVALSRRLGDRGVGSFSVHPGGVWTTQMVTSLTMEDFLRIDGIARENVGRGFTLDAEKTLSQGTAPLLVAALDPGLMPRNGAFVEDCQEGTAYEYAIDEVAADKLWDLSEVLLGQKFEVRN